MSTSPAVGRLVTRGWLSVTRDEARALIAGEPVVPVRVLRDWIEQERRVRIVPTGYDHGVNAKLDALSRVLDDYEKENPDG